MPQLLEMALAEASNFEWDSFSVSSSFPKEVFVRESEIEDFFAPGQFTSLKNRVNSEIASQISASTSKRLDQKNPDAIFELDFGKMAAHAKPAPLHVFGHYLKLSRKHCQSRWNCSACGGRGCKACKGSGTNYPSVEDEVGQAIAPAFAAEKYRLHASGREDVDVRTLGFGRPFVLELIGPKKRNADLASIEQALSKNEHVRAHGLALVGKHFINAVCDSHFEKEYSALVAADRPLGMKDAKKVELLSGTTIEQRTPIRVSHRRSDMIRKRKIISVKASAVEGGKLRLLVRAEAGTYIKELISSDGGRTKPSVSSILSCHAFCEELDVIAIYDYFLETVAHKI
jgi:tRNA pseudouridine synthase 10